MTKTELNLSWMSVLGSYRYLWIYYSEVIIQFLSEYEDLVYSADVTDEQLDTLIEEGEVINSQLERLQIHLENYNGNKISFKELVEAINPVRILLL